jgi:sugar phosphate isomerase/epimerase
MPPVFSLAFLTSTPLDPPEAIRLAAECGYGAVGLRALPASPGGPYSRLVEDQRLRAETRAVLADTGVAAFDMEIVRLGPAFALDAVRPFLDVAEELGAKAVLVAGDDPDEARLVANFAAFAEAAGAHGLTADLEFMPWTPVADAATAMRVVEASGAPNGGILVDALHVARSRTSLADIAAIPRARLSYVQICDAPAAVPETVEGLIHDARCARLLPGEGEIDLVGLLARLPGDLPISLEIPNDARKPQVGVAAWARAAIEAGRRVVAAAEAERLTAALRP